MKDKQKNKPKYILNKYLPEDFNWKNKDLIKGGFINKIIKDRVIKDVDFSLSLIKYCKFIRCIFIGVNFGSVHLYKTKFKECGFYGCNMSALNSKFCTFEDPKFNPGTIVSVKLAKQLNQRDPLYRLVNRPVKKF